MSEKKLYYKKVWELTEKNCKKIKDIHLRGENFHLDHIIPISFGFKYYINEEIIASEKNIRIITKKNNFLKNSQITEEVENKLKEFNICVKNIIPRQNKEMNKKKQKELDFILSRPKISKIMTKDKNQLIHIY